MKSDITLLLKAILIPLHILQILSFLPVLHVLPIFKDKPNFITSGFYHASIYEMLSRYENLLNSRDSVHF